MLFVIGLITSVHCIAMCGGINLSQTLQKQEANAEEISRSMFRNTFSYNMRRVVSYTVIGGFLGAVGGLAGFTGFHSVSGVSETPGRNYHGRYGCEYAGDFSGASETENPHSISWREIFMEKKDTFSSWTV